MFLRQRSMGRLATLALAALLPHTRALAASPKAEPGAVRICVRRAGNQDRILGAGDFVVRVNGKPAPVLNAKTSRDSEMILLVLDLAGDITDAQTAKEALISEIRKLPPTTSVALIRAQDGPTVLTDPTVDREAIAAAIDADPVTGKAGLLNSLLAMGTLAENISKASNVRVATLYVTDSDVRNYREDFANPVINSSDPHDLSRKFPEALIQDKIDKMEKAISARETPLFIVHLRYRNTTLNGAYQAGLRRLAETTAGWSTFCASPAEIPGAIEQAFAAIGSEYMLTVGLPGRPPASLQVHVTTKAPSDPPLDLVYRQRLLMRQR